MAHEQRRQGDPPPERPAFHELLLRYRTAANESLQEFAEALRVSPKAVKTYERPPQHPSARTPPTEVFRRLCVHLREKGVLQGGEYAAFAAAWTARRRYRHGRTASVLPAAPALDDATTNLPAPVTGFVGRVAELEEVKRELAGTRLLTLVGPGGSGKTQLALKVANDLRDRYRGGAWLVRLDALENADLLVPNVAQALGVREGVGDLLDTLVRVLRRQPRLLLLDSCEHLITACAQLVEALLSACPDLHILATSREPLRLPAWERVWPVPPLATPPASSRLSVDELLQYDAVQLFLRRAQGATLTDDNAAAVVAICRRLDGIPLAIELAAARLPTLSAQQLAARLRARFEDVDDRFELLKDGGRTAPPRQQTLKATMDWSYTLLSAPEQALLRRLSIFVGGWTLAAAEAVCTGDEVSKEAVLDRLTELVNKSLVQVIAPGADEARYGLLETVRQYARAHLDAAGETDQMRRRHRDWYLQLAEQAAAEWPSPERWLRSEWVAVDAGNLRAALTWSLSQPGEAGIGARLAVALWRFWEIRGEYVEGRGWLERALAAYPDAPLAVRAHLLSGIGNFAVDQNDAETAVRRLEESLTLFRQLGDRPNVAAVLHKWGVMALWRGNYPRAAAVLKESIALWQELGDRRGVADAQTYLGHVACFYPEAGDPAALFAESLSVFRQLGDREGIANSLFGLAFVAFFAGDQSRARELAAECLSLYHELGHKGGMAMLLESCAIIAAIEGAGEVAARLLGAADALREAINSPRPPSYSPIYDTYVSSLPGAFPAAWTQGQAMPLDEAIALALTIARAV
jgi:predicted ATPase